MTEKTRGLLLVSHLFIRASFVIRHLSFVISFAWLRIGKFCYCWIDFQVTKARRKNMLHLIWYIFVGFLVGCVAKALMHMHLSITWTVVLGIVGSIIGGAVTHLFYPPSAGGKISSRRINCFNRWGRFWFCTFGNKFRLQLPRG